jgi:hypothetical protein
MPATAGKKPISAKANQNAKCPCRNKWEVNRFDRICSGMRDPDTNMWWSEDQTGHGNSAWKVYDRQGVWVADADADADVYGDYMDKHKSDKSKSINFDSLKCKESH